MTDPTSPPIPGYRVRPAQLSDAGRLAEMLLALQDHLEASNTNLWHMTSKARLNLPGQVVSRLTATGSLVLLAECNQDEIVGMVFGRVVTNSRYEPPRAGVIDQVYVDPEHRRRGVGQRLVAELCRFFAGEGVEDLSLRYVSGNAEAAAFWSVLGFEPRIITAGAGLQQVEATLSPKR